jgi:CBS domain-containing protein
MSEQRKDLLPVVREGKLIGIVGKADIVRSMAE